jgi:hypothetical protein
MRTKDLSPELEWPGSEVDHWVPSSNEVKNDWIYTSNPAECMQGMNKKKLTFLINPIPSTEHV